VAAPPIALRTLSPSSPDDEAALYALFAAVRAEELGMETWDAALREQVLRQQFDAQRQGYRVRHPGADERLILCGDAPIGWVIVDRTGSELRGIDVALVPAARRQGIGRLIIRDLQQEAALHDWPMRIDVARGNVRARALYERLGFVSAGESDTHAQMEWRAAPLPTSAAEFRQHVDTALRIDVADGELPLRIAEVEEGRSDGGMQRFSVLLHGPAGALLPQGSHLVHHDALGSFVLFIVPVLGSDAERIVYEARFSRSAPAAP
jgi:GNAT superfamily N-acetyltransferase